MLGGTRYIATQGPRDTSTSHFWRMLASETSNSAVVVMLTQTHEAGREKCFQYFPLDDTNSTMTITPDPEIADDFEAQITLASSNDDVRSHSTIRHLKLRTKKKKTGVEGGEDEWTDKHVYHLLFSGWPDFLVPEGDDKMALVELIKLSRLLNKNASPPSSSSFDAHEQQQQDTTLRNKSVSSIASNTSTSTSTRTSRFFLAGPQDLNPRIIHCSAGVGRSGTFIALDHLLMRLDAGQLDEVPGNADPVAETVDKLRRQRMMMVQGEAQFCFLYDVLRTLWVERWRNRGRVG